MHFPLPPNVIGVRPAQAGAGRLLTVQAVGRPGDAHATR